MTSETVTLIVGVLGFITGIAGLIAARSQRLKTLAEVKSIQANTTTTDLTAFDKFSDLLKKHQDRNDELYQENVLLEKGLTEKTRQLDILTARLENKDTQIIALNRQLSLLQDLAKSAPITDTLKAQLESMNLIVTRLQDAQQEATKVLATREAAFQKLMDTNRDLTLKKPPTE